MSGFDYDNYISPCKDICKLDSERKYCTGCFRTVEERRYWSKYTKEEKLEIMAHLSERENSGFPFDKID